MNMPGIERINGQFVFTATLGLSELRNLYSKAEALLKNIGKYSSQPDSSWRIFSSCDEAHEALQIDWAKEMVHKEPWQEPLATFPYLLLNQRQTADIRSVFDDASALESRAWTWFHANMPERAWEDFQRDFAEMKALALYGDQPNAEAAKARWSVWEAGYCLAGSFKGQMFVY